MRGLQETYDHNFEINDLKRFLEMQNRVHCDSKDAFFEGLLQLTSEQLTDQRETIFILTITDDFCTACAELKAEINEWGQKETIRIVNLEAQFK
ncbi:hypothetical protein [Aliidiomarina haloalkalitolerans]|nr:hypothetical protein [Aliidiomarina haloalkalitolerans]